MKIKILSFFLAILMISACFVSCQKQETEEDYETDTVTTDAETEKVARTFNDLQAVDFGGENFTILTRDRYNGLWDPFEYDSEGLNGDTLNDSVYERNCMVEEKFNCNVIQIADEGYGNTALAAFLSMTAEEYDVIVLPIMNSIGMLALTGYSYNFKNIESVDLDDAWWDQGVNNSLSLVDRYYTICGDLNLNDDIATWCVCFNKKIARDYGIDHYVALNDGTWTLESMYTNAKKFAVDSSYDGSRYGICTQAEFGEALLLADNKYCFTKDNNGIPRNNMRDSSFTETVFTIFDYMKDTNVNLLGHNKGETEGYEGYASWGSLYGMFSSGDSFYLAASISTVMNSNKISAMQDGFGILPIPKFNADGEYVSTFQVEAGTSISILSNHPNAEKIGTFLTAMNAASSTTVIPALYETTLERREVPDSDSLVSLDIIFANRVIDIGYTVSSGVRSIIKDTLNDLDGTINFESIRMKNMGNIEDSIDTIVEAIRSDFAIVPQQ